MTSSLDRIGSMNPAAAAASQGTAIEQSRAIAEVQAAIVVAKQCPRDLAASIKAMRESCAQKGLAERAFYRFPRGGQQLSGPSVHLARELARCWGNVQYGVTELSRDDYAGQSEMQAFAWDVENNTRSSQIFIAPHKRDKRGGAEKVTDLRDIYENNANLGSRRLREAIFSILPPWFVEEAKEACIATLSGGGGKSLAQRSADAVRLFGALGVSLDQLEQKLGRPTAHWTDHDVAQLVVVYMSMQRGEATREQEFPARRVTLDDIASPPPAEADRHVPIAPPDQGPQ